MTHGYEIMYGKYLDENNAAASVTLKNNKTGKQVPYNWIETDAAPLNRIIGALLESDDSMMAPYSPPPFDEDERAALIKNRLDSERIVADKATEQLAILKSPAYREKCLADPELAARVTQSVSEWETVTEQHGYPWQIDWPELWPVTPPQAE